MNTLRDILNAIKTDDPTINLLAKQSADVLDIPLKIQITIVSGEHNDVYDIRIDDAYLDRNKKEIELAAYADYNSKQSI